MTESKRRFSSVEGRKFLDEAEEDKEMEALKHLTLDLFMYSTETAQSYGASPKACVLAMLNAVVNTFVHFIDKEDMKKDADWALEVFTRMMGEIEETATMAAIQEQMLEHSRDFGEGHA